MAKREKGAYGQMEDDVNQMAVTVPLIVAVIGVQINIVVLYSFTDKEWLAEKIDNLLNNEAVEDIADVSARDFNEVDHDAIRSSLTSLGNGDFVAAFGDAVLINPHVNGAQLDAEHILVSSAGQWYEYTSRAGQSECAISYNPAQEFERACVAGAVEMSPELRAAACASADNLRSRETSLILNEHAQGFLARHCG